MFEVVRANQEGRRSPKSVMAAIVLVALPLTCVSGCTTEVVSEENLGEEDFLLGEVACATQSCTAANSCETLAAPPFPFCSFNWSWAESPSATYGNASCPNAYTIEVSATTGATFLPQIKWADTPLTSANCASAKLDMVVHTRPTSSSSWTSTISRYHGEWQDLAFNQSYCAFMLNSGYSGPAPITKTSTNQIRVAGTAKVGSTGWRAVAVGLRTGNGPC